MAHESFPHIGHIPWGHVRLDVVHGGKDKTASGRQIVNPHGNLIEYLLPCALLKHMLGVDSCVTLSINAWTKPFCSIILQNMLSKPHSRNAVSYTPP